MAATSERRSRRRAWLAVATLALVCVPGAAVAQTGAEATCAPAGTELQIAAENKQFDKNCLAAPADQAFTIAFDNRDVAVPHNVSIYDSANKALFKGEIIVGPNQTTYSVPALAAGRYEFRCDPHDDTMIGTFIVA